MPSNTTFRGYTYPVLADANNVPFYMQQALQQIDTDVETAFHPACFVGGHSASQNVPHATVTALAMNTEALDTHNGHSTSTNNSRYVIPSGQAGLWRASGQFRWSTHSGGMRRGGFRVNGGATLYYQYYMPGAGAGAEIAIPIGGGIIPVYLNVGDYIETVAWQNTSTTMTVLSTEFEICYQRVAELP